MYRILKVIKGCLISNGFLILVLVIIILLPTPEPTAKSEKKVPKKKYFQRFSKPQYHRNLYRVDQPTIVKWSSRDIINVSKIPRAKQLICGNLLCDYYDYPVMLPRNAVGAYIFYGTAVEFKDLPLPRQPVTKIWGLFHEESPKYVPEFMFESGLRLFNYSSTFSRYSDVPFPLQWLSSYYNIASRTYFIPTPKKNSLLSEISPILYLQSMCRVPSERDLYVIELMKYQRIDSYGSCLKNKEISKTLRRKYLYKLEAANFLKFVARYKFVLALENGVCDDYVTEKFWRAIHVGTVPIYFGTPTVKNWMPNEKSAILLQDFPTPKLLSDHIDMLMQDDKLYDEYLEHKTHGIIRNQNIFKELTARPYQSVEASSFREFQCFICGKLHNYERIPKNRIINKKHYNCPRPISVLSQRINPSNPYISMLDLVKSETEKNIYFIKTFKGNDTSTN